MVSMQGLLTVLHGRTSLYRTCPTSPKTECMCCCPALAGRNHPTRQGKERGREGAGARTFRGLKCHPTLAVLLYYPRSN